MIKSKEDLVAGQYVEITYWSEGAVVNGLVVPVVGLGVVSGSYRMLASFHGDVVAVIPNQYVVIRRNNGRQVAIIWSSIETTCIL